MSSYDDILSDLDLAETAFMSTNSSPGASFISTVTKWAKRACLATMVAGGCLVLGRLYSKYSRSHKSSRRSRARTTTGKAPRSSATTKTTNPTERSSATTQDTHSRSSATTRNTDPRSSPTMKTTNTRSSAPRGTSPSTSIIRDTDTKLSRTRAPTYDRASEKSEYNKSKSKASRPTSSRARLTKRSDKEPTVRKTVIDGVSSNQPEKSEPSATRRPGGILKGPSTAFQETFDEESTGSATKTKKSTIQFKSKPVVVS